VKGFESRQSRRRRQAGARVSNFHKREDFGLVQVDNTKHSKGFTNHNGQGSTNLDEPQFFF
jgi:hypothetical protein